MLGNLIKTNRERFRMSQTQLATILGLTQEAISKYENNVREPSVETLKKLCVLFNCTADELLEIDTASERAKVQINNSFNGNNINVKIK